jgi:hypothetical protein
MPHEIIMPVLGMSQDTGVIANWCKSHGDYVEVGELLMEIETDKAVQEIEAAASGYLNIAGHAEGIAIPVGVVVATLTEGPVDMDAIPIPSPVSEPAIKSATVLVVDTPTPDKPVRVVADTQPAQGGTILASAKARATAYRNNIELCDIAEAQGKSILHALDVEQYLVALKQSAAPIAAYAPGTAIEKTSRFDVKVNGKGFKYCQEWLLKHHDLGHRLLGSHIVATLVLGLWRERFAQDSEANATIRVDYSDREGMQSELLLNPDRQRFSQLKAEQSELNSPCDIRLVDLMSTRLSAYEPGMVTGPVLVLCKEEEELKLALYGVDSAMLSTTIGFMDSLADQLEEPLVHIA